MQDNPLIELILGGARSGKSRLAEQRASDSALEVIYIATSQPLDGEMHERIRQPAASPRAFGADRGIPGADAGAA